MFIKPPHLSYIIVDGHLLPTIICPWLPTINNYWLPLIMTDLLLKFTNILLTIIDFLIMNPAYFKLSLTPIIGHWCRQLSVTRAIVNCQNHCHRLFNDIKDYWYSLINGHGYCKWPLITVNGPGLSLLFKGLTHKNYICRSFAFWQWTH